MCCLWPACCPSSIRWKPARGLPMMCHWSTNGMLMVLPMVGSCSARFACLWLASGLWPSSGRLTGQTYARAIGQTTVWQTYEQTEHWQTIKPTCQPASHPTVFMASQAVCYKARPWLSSDRPDGQIPRQTTGQTADDRWTKHWTDRVIGELLGRQHRSSWSSCRPSVHGIARS